MANEEFKNTVLSDHPNKIKHITRKEFENLNSPLSDVCYVVNDSAINDDAGANLQEYASASIYLGSVPITNVLFFKSLSDIPSPEIVKNKILIVQETKPASTEQNLYAELFAQNANSIIYSTVDEGEYWDTFPSQAVGPNTSIQDEYNKLVLTSNKYSGELLAEQGIQPIKVNNFVWHFQYRCPENATTAKTSFCFHINENSVLADNGFYNKKNVLAVTINGPSVSETASDTKKNTIVIQIPGVDGSLVALDYTLSGNIRIPTEDAYVQLSDKFDLSKWSNITIQLVDQELTVTIIQEGISISKVFSLPKEAVTLAPDGDFGVITSTVGCYLQNMKIFQVPKNVSNSVIYLEPKLYTSDGLKLIPLTPTDANIDLHLENMMDVESSNSKSLGDTLRWNGTKWAPMMCNPMWENPSNI